MFEELCSPETSPSDFFTAGCILSNMAVILPSSTWSQAALTAPQLSCPSTKINLLPATLQEYSILPKISVFSKFPATLATKTSPIVWSKINSTGTLESIHESTIAFGCCPVVVCVINAL